MGGWEVGIGEEEDDEMVYGTRGREVEKMLSRRKGLEIRLHCEWLTGGSE